MAVLGWRERHYSPGARCSEHLGISGGNLLPVHETHLLGLLFLRKTCFFVQNITYLLPCQNSRKAKFSIKCFGQAENNRWFSSSLVFGVANDDFPCIQFDKQICKHGDFGWITKGNMWKNDAWTEFGILRSDLEAGWKNFKGRGRDGTQLGGRTEDKRKLSVGTVEQFPLRAVIWFPESSPPSLDPPSLVHRPAALRKYFGSWVGKWR